MRISYRAHARIMRTRTRYTYTPTFAVKENSRQRKTRPHNVNDNGNYFKAFIKRAVASVMLVT